MGCPTHVELEDNITFSITTHDPDTGILTDADAVPTYRIYEESTEVAILNGDIDDGTGGTDQFDDGNTTGFYVKTLDCTAVAGFEEGKTYSVYIEAVVGGDKGAISYAFKISSTYKAITQAAAGSMTGIGPEYMLQRIYARLFHKINIIDATGAIAIRANDDLSQLASSGITDDDTTTVQTLYVWD